jgi:hypothetical protein
MCQVGTSVSYVRFIKWGHCDCPLDSVVESSLYSCLLLAPSGVSAAAENHLTLLWGGHEPLLMETGEVLGLPVTLPKAALPSNKQGCLAPASVLFELSPLLLPFPLPLFINTPCAGDPKVMHSLPSVVCFFSPFPTPGFMLIQSCSQLTCLRSSNEKAQFRTLSTV